jgi:hypothetical protein
LSQSPEWCGRVQREADREFDDASDGLADRLIETRAVIDEVNRRYPPIISRVAIGRDDLAGESIKPGTMIVIAPHVIHRHRALWKKADSFDPSRFLGKARQSIDRLVLSGLVRGFALGRRLQFRKHQSLSPRSCAISPLKRYRVAPRGPAKDYAAAERWVTNDRETSLNWLTPVDTGQRLAISN